MGDKRDPKRDQPLPTPGTINVQEVLSASILERMQYGVNKYGHPLETFNGRDPVRDVWEELLDALTYMTQVRLERGDVLPGMNPGERVVAADLTLPVVRCNTCGGVRSKSAYDVADALQRQGWILTALARVCDTGSMVVPVNLVKAILDGDLSAGFVDFKTDAPAANVIPEGHPAYNLVQDLIEGDGPTQDAAREKLAKIWPTPASED